MDCSLHRIDFVDAGVCEKSNLDSEEDEQVNYSSELNDEILQAPWNTTRAYLGALKGKCLMQIFGIGGKENLSVYVFIEFYFS